MYVLKAAKQLFYCV